MTNIVHVDDARARIVEAIKLHPHRSLYERQPVAASMRLLDRGHPNACTQWRAVSRRRCAGRPAGPPGDQDVLGLAHDPPALRRGAFIGGCDIVLEMHETSELAEALGIHRTAAAS